MLDVDRELDGLRQPVKKEKERKNDTRRNSTIHIWGKSYPIRDIVSPLIFKLLKTWSCNARSSVYMFEETE